MSSVFQPGAPPAGASVAIQTWQLMGNTLDWGALPVIVELLGVEDVETLVSHLTVLREHTQQKSNLGQAHH